VNAPNVSSVAALGAPLVTKQAGRVPQHDLSKMTSTWNMGCPTHRSPLSLGVWKKRFGGFETWGPYPECYIPLFAQMQNCVYERHFPRMLLPLAQCFGVGNLNPKILDDPNPTPPTHPGVSIIRSGDSPFTLIKKYYIYICILTAVLLWLCNVATASCKLQV